MSYVDNLPIQQLIGGRLAQTLKLTGITTLVVLSLTLGIATALYRGSIYHRIVSMLTIGVISVPEFMVAVCAVLLFAVYLGWQAACLRHVRHQADFRGLGVDNSHNAGGADRDARDLLR